MNCGPFSVELLENEQYRLTSLLRNNGFFYYKNSDIIFRADTLQQPGKVWLQIQPEENIPNSTNRQWYIGNITIDIKENSNQPLTDTLRATPLNIHYTGKRVPLRPDKLRS